MPVMAMMGTPFSPEQLDEIRALSNQYGFTLREMDASVHYPADALEDCEILLGYFPRGLLKARTVFAGCIFPRRVRTNTRTMGCTTVMRSP